MPSLPVSSKYSNRWGQPTSSSDSTRANSCCWRSIHGFPLPRPFEPPLDTTKRQCASNTICKARSPRSGRSGPGALSATSRTWSSMIAIISDTHGNYPALEAVLRDVAREQCEAVYSLGDVAGYYCMLNECVEALRERNIPNVMGNHDKYLSSAAECPRSLAATRCIAFQRSIVS